MAGRTVIDDWINIAGGVNAADVVGNGRPVTMEQVAAWNPDVIIVGTAPNQQNRQAILDDPRWREINAVKNGKVFVNPSGAYLWDRHSAEAALQVLWAAKLLHPASLPISTSAGNQVVSMRKFFHYELTRCRSGFDLERDRTLSKRARRAADLWRPWRSCTRRCSSAALPFRRSKSARILLAHVFADRTDWPRSVGNHRAADQAAARRPGACSSARVSRSAARPTRACSVIRWSARTSSASPRHRVSAPPWRCCCREMRWNCRSSSFAFGLARRAAHLPARASVSYRRPC